MPCQTETGKDRRDPGHQPCNFYLGSSFRSNEISSASSRILHPYQPATGVQRSFIFHFYISVLIIFQYWYLFYFVRSIFHIFKSVYQLRHHAFKFFQNFIFSNSISSFRSLPLQNSCNIGVNPDFKPQISGINVGLLKIKKINLINQLSNFLNIS